MVEDAVAQSPDVLKTHFYMTFHTEYNAQITLNTFSFALQSGDKEIICLKTRGKFQHIETCAQCGIFLE